MHGHLLSFAQVLAGGVALVHKLGEGEATIHQHTCASRDEQAKKQRSNRGSTKQNGMNKYNTINMIKMLCVLYCLSWVRLFFVVTDFFFFFEKKIF